MEECSGVCERVGVSQWVYPKIRVGRPGPALIKYFGGGTRCGLSGIPTGIQNQYKICHG